MADYNGDCDVDFQDEWHFFQNEGGVPHPCCQVSDPVCCPPTSSEEECASLTCPSWLGGSSQGGGDSPPAGPLEPLAAAQDFVEYLTLEPLSDEEAEEDFVAFTQEVTDWLVVNVVRLRAAEL